MDFQKRIFKLYFKIHFQNKCIFKNAFENAFLNACLNAFFSANSLKSAAGSRVCRSQLLWIRWFHHQCIRSASSSMHLVEKEPSDNKKI